MHIRIITRNSRLAMWQAQFVAGKLEKAGASAELIPISTKGDKVLDVTIEKIGSKGVFTEELEDALAGNTADIAVHSAKDLQSHLPEGFELSALTRRERANDVLVSNRKLSMDDMPVVGTSSVRRVAMLKHYYPGIKTIPVRGNLQTRIRKMEEGECDALMLAFAGVHRMGYDSLIRQQFPEDMFVPPVGQGTIGIETHESLDPEIRTFIQDVLNDPETALCLTAERSFLRRLEGGCSIPSFGLATISNDLVHLSCGLISPDGSKLIRRHGQSTIDMASDLGIRLAEEVLAAGGDKILSDLKSASND